MRNRVARGGQRLQALAPDGRRDELVEALLDDRRFCLVDEIDLDLVWVYANDLVVASETEEGAKLRIQLVKKLTGDERIKARRMRQDFRRVVGSAAQIPVDDPEMFDEGRERRRRIIAAQ